MQESEKRFKTECYVHPFRTDMFANLPIKKTYM